MDDQEDRDYRISTIRVCLEIEHIFYDADADADVLRHTVTVDFSGHPYITRHRPTPLARREGCSMRGFASNSGVGQALRVSCLSPQPVPARPMSQLASLSRCRSS
ncbi:hypothetical protein ACFYPN_31950 [Streptomyces sp. NPDC005576]|uniref:hypothetical protein n=1 Tax=unclassified Streptomyces TaxID=2593676 RepID=UPI0033F05F8D